jgi:hypothetical protein
MKALRIVLISLVALIALVTATFFLIGYFKPKPGGIFIDTSPSSNVYINDALVGKTPYTNSYKAGEIALKLVPNSTDKKLLAYETKITLISGVQTVVRREFGMTEDDSSGDVIFFDNASGQDAGLIVISTPENAQVSVDGVPQGFAPYKSSSISPAQHQITVKAPGFTDRIMTVKTLAGFRLSLYAKLAKTAEPEPPPAPAPQVKTSVQILTTPTGFLRVRTQPGTRGEEIAQVKTGSSYQYLSTDAATGWIEIQYEEPAPGLPNGITGWVSNQYVKISTSSATLQ